VGTVIIEVATMDTTIIGAAIMDTTIRLQARLLSEECSATLLRREGIENLNSFIEPFM